MPETTEELLRRAQAALDPGFRFQLLSRGAARALVWREGILPLEGAPHFSSLLSQDLANFGFGMLGLGLELRDREDRSETTYRVFEVSSRALEAILVDGRPDQADRDFYTIMAAAAAHIGRFSARAASLLNKVGIDVGGEQMPVLRALRLLMLRKLDELRALLIAEIPEAGAWDYWATQQIANNSRPAQDIACSFIRLTILHAIAEFTSALVTGDADSVQRSRNRLLETEALAMQLSHPIYWWICRITRHLLDDLWLQTLHVQLPIAPEGAAGNWPEWRRFFISVLAARSTAEVELWPSQIEPVRNIFVHPHLVASLPTSAGKTRIAEIAILWAVSRGKKVLFVTPLRALSAQTERSLARLFEPFNLSVTSFYSGSGFTPGEAAMLNESHIGVCTPEKLDFALRNQPELLQEVGCIVLDEGHMLGLGEREIRYEVLIQRLTQIAGAAERRIVCLSAMLPSGDETDDFAQWLGSGQTCPVFSQPWKPTRRIVGEVTWKPQAMRGDYSADCDGTPTYLYNFVTGTTHGNTTFPSRNLDFTLACASRLVTEGRSVMIYCAQRSEVENIANGFVSSINAGYLQPFTVANRAHLEEEIRYVSEWLPAGHTIFQALRNGLAVHHAQLPRPIQQLVEDLLRKRIISAVVASPTLAQGLNLSASCLLFHSVQRFIPGKGPRHIGGDEVANVAGRAGRAYVDVEGLVLGMAYSTAQANAWRRMKRHAVSGQAKIESGLLLVIQALLDRIATKAEGGDVAEWTLNHSPIGEAPQEDEDEQEEAQSWGLLDMAILALVGDREADATQIPTVLDEVLRNSYFRRRLARIDAQRRDMVDSIIKNRAIRIWTRTDPASRAAWHRAGISVDSGLSLEAEFDLLLEPLRRAQTAAITEDYEAFIESIAQMAEILWRIPPFSPYSMPASNSEILKSWLRGVAGSDLVGLDPAAMNFVEDAIIYRLTWGVEAVRMLAVSRGHDEFDSDSGQIISRLEHGLCERTALLFRQAGLNSRVTCQALAQCFTPPLTSMTQLGEWMRSAWAAQWSSNPLVPSPETHHIWIRFFENARARREDRRRYVSLQLNVISASPVPNGAVVARSLGGTSWELHSTNLAKIGAAASASPFPAGIFAFGNVAGGIATTGCWMGPDPG
jgi:replicative superfamily II helicase